MQRKMYLAFLVVFGLVFSAQARYIDNNVYTAASDEDDDGILPLPFNNFEDKDDEEDNYVPNLDVRLGVPIDYDADRSKSDGVVLRTKIGEDGLPDDLERNGAMEKKEPGWVKRQWRRLGELSGALSNSRKVSSAKVAEFTEKICTLLKFMTTKAAKICDVIPLKFCSSFYGPVDPDSIYLPEANSLEM